MGKKKDKRNNISPIYVVLIAMVVVILSTVSIIKFGINGGKSNKPIKGKDINIVESSDEDKQFLYEFFNITEDEYKMLVEKEDRDLYEEVVVDMFKVNDKYLSTINTDKFKKGTITINDKKMKLGDLFKERDKFLYESVEHADDYMDASYYINNFITESILTNYFTEYVDSVKDDLDFEDFKNYVYVNYDTSIANIEDAEKGFIFDYLVQEKVADLYKDSIIPDKDYIEYFKDNVYDSKDVYLMYTLSGNNMDDIEDREQHIKEIRNFVETIRADLDIGDFDAISDYIEENDYNVKTFSMFKDISNKDRDNNSDNLIIFDQDLTEGRIQLSETDYILDNDYSIDMLFILGNEKLTDKQVAKIISSSESRMKFMDVKQLILDLNEKLPDNEFSISKEIIEILDIEDELQQEYISEINQSIDKDFEESEENVEDDNKE